MSIAAMKKAYKAMGLLGPDLICEISHHNSKDQHGVFTPCPIEHRWREAYKALGAAIEQAPRQWQELTDEEIAVIMVQELGVDEDIDAMSYFARAVEANLRERNS